MCIEKETPVYCIVRVVSEAVDLVSSILNNPPQKAVREYLILIIKENLGHKRKKSSTLWPI